MIPRTAKRSIDERTEVRHAALSSTAVLELGASGMEAKVLNISERGFMAESEGHFEVGSRVWLMLPGRERANAVVRWTAGDKLGAEFAEPISVEAVKSFSVSG